MSDPLTGEKVALLQQDYIKRLVQSDEMFNNITVLAEDEGNVESAMDIALGIVTSQSGAIGACVIVRQPVGDDEMPGVQFPPLGLEWDVMCLEWVQVNKDTANGGTGKRAWHMARRIHRLMKNHRAPGLIQNITIRKPAIVRSSFIRDLPNGVITPLVGYTVRVAANEADNTPYLKVSPPALSGNPALTSGVIWSGSAGTEVTVTCATSGAVIYYTTDLSNPFSQNSNATLYTAPITVVAGTYLFRAFNDDGTGNNIGSDAVALSVT